MIDSSLLQVDPQFRAVLSEIAGAVYKRAWVKPGRAAHDSGIVAHGHLLVLDSPLVPAHRLLEPGASYEVLLRHSNARGFPDDAVLDGRGAALRLLQPGHATVEDALLDLIMVTGRTFVARDARAFSHWATADGATKAQLLRNHPAIAESLAELIRDPESYSDLYYYSQVASRFLGRDGVSRLARFRLIPASRAADSGYVDPAKLRLPLDYAPRRADDDRAPDYLRADLRDRIERGDARYLLQIQLAADADDPDTLDPSLYWDEASHSWLDVASIELAGLLRAEEGEALELNPANAPADLGLIRARSVDDPASVNHARAIAYAMSARARKNQELPPVLRELVYLPGEYAAPEDDAGTIKAAIAAGALAVHYQKLPWTAGSPREAIPTALRRSGLAAAPDALKRVLDRFDAMTGSAAWESADRRPLPELKTWGDKEAAFYHMARMGDAAALENLVLKHSPISLEAFTWDGMLGVQFFRTRAEYMAYMSRTVRILEADFALPGCLLLAPDQALIVFRLLSVDRATQTAVLSEYAGALKRSLGGPWEMDAVIETDYLEEPLQGDGRSQMETYGARVLEPAESEFKLSVAATAQLLVDEWEASLKGSGDGQSGPEAAPADRPMRVCVVGAGPAGLTTALELQRRGHQVTVIEKADTIAGKAGSLEIEDHWYDLGAHIQIGEHLAVWQLANEMGCEIEEVVASRLFDIESRSVVVPRNPFADRSAMAAYQAFRQQRFPNIQAGNLKEVGHGLDAPIPDVLATEGGKPLAAVGIAYTASGYGFLDDADIPALYLVRLAEIGSMLDETAPFERIHRWTIKGGFLELWRRVAGELTDVRLGVRVEAIERSAGGVDVRARGRTEHYDALVLACPLNQVGGFVDLDSEERDLFGRIRTIDYYTTFATVSGLPRHGFYLVKQHIEDSATAGHATIFHHRYDDTDVYIFYSYGGPGVTPADVQRGVFEDVERMGGKVEMIHAQKRWAYFPHVNSADLEAGFYERLDAHQGQNATYYVGGLLAYELVETIIRQARDLVGLHFPVVAGAAVPAITTAAAAAARVVEAAEAVDAPPGTGRSAGEIREWMVAQIARRANLDPSGIDASDAFETLPIESLQIVGMVADLSRWLDWQVTPSIIFECPTIDAIARQLAADVAEARAASPIAAPAETGAGVLGRMRGVLKRS
ncbi:MAG: FAD-dependent oxidoreductase [Chloroflexi bacterium]|nr:FAD-dependent oxidoreductase [Chloroflexota bacterium]